MLIKLIGIVIYLSLMAANVVVIILTPGLTVGDCFSSAAIGIVGGLLIAQIIGWIMD